MHIYTAKMIGKVCFLTTLAFLVCHQFVIGQDHYPGRDPATIKDDTASTILRMQKDHEQLRNYTYSAVEYLNSSISVLRSRISTAERKIRNLEGKVQHEALTTMLKEAKAILYTNDDLTGEYEEYDIRYPGFRGTGCSKLGKARRIKSVNSLGTCVRLFEFLDCGGWSLAVYPNSSLGITIPKELDGVGSIGPCVEHEFDYAYIDNWEDSTSNRVKKRFSTPPSYNELPDLIPTEFVGPSKINNNGNPITQYKLGPGNRLELIQGFIKSNHLRSLEHSFNLLNSGSNSEAYKAVSSKLVKGSGDIVGFAFPLEVGGPSDQAYNVFVQSAAADKTFRSVIPSIHQYINGNQRNNYVWLGVRLYYDSEQDTKPTGIWYNLAYYNSPYPIKTYDYIKNK